uniref:Protein SIX6OS1 n=1 Tax=Callorhinchus milii TaxID=7868 RepID=A0A4W3GSL1_CALMI
MYQDYLNQYREILQQHQSQYSEFPQAKEYFKKKVEFEEIQSRVLDCTEQIQQKTQAINDLSEPSLFGSLHEWALEIAALKVDTQNVLIQVAYTKDKAVEEHYENQESPAQLDNFESSEGIKVPDFSNLPNKEQKQSIYQQKEYKIALNPTVNSEQTQPQNVVTYCQKSLTSKPFELMLEQSESDTELGKNNKQQTNNVILPQVNSVQTEYQRNVELRGIQQQTCFQITPATKNQGQIQYRSLVPKNQTDTLQWLQSTATTSANSDTDEMNSSQYKSHIPSDSLYKSPAQIDPKSVNDDQEETTNKTSQMFSRTPEYAGPSQKEFEMDCNPQHEKTSSESPRFSFLGVSTPKTSGFDMFGRLAFGFPDTPEQVNDRQMAGNQFEFSSLFFKKTVQKIPIAKCCWYVFSGSDSTGLAEIQTWFKFSLRDEKLLFLLSASPNSAIFYVFLAFSSTIVLQIQQNHIKATSRVRSILSTKYTINPTLQYIL